MSPSYITNRRAENSARLYFVPERLWGIPGAWEDCFLTVARGRPPAAPLQFVLFQFKSTGVELVIGALLGDELLVGAPLNDPALVKHHDAVGISHR